MLIVTRYIGKAHSEKLPVFKAKKLVAFPKMAVVYASPDSVSGNLHDLMSVGSAAKASLIIANEIAITGLSVICQIMRAKIETAPQK